MNVRGDLEMETTSLIIVVVVSVVGLLLVGFAIWLLSRIEDPPDEERPPTTNDIDY